MTSGNCDTLRDLPREDLLALWRAQTNLAPPKGMSRVMLARIIAYDQQGRAYGRLKPGISKRLLRIASGDAPTRPTPRLRPGSRLVREWNGVSHVVEILDNGVLYDGKRFTSLTAVAKQITGAHWSGPRFFGLKKQHRWQ